MVQIRRGAAAFSTSSSSSNVSLVRLWLTWRTVLLLIIGIQGTRLLYKLLLSNNNNNNNKSHHPAAVAAVVTTLEKSLPQTVPLSKVVHTTRVAAARSAAAKDQNHNIQTQRQQQQKAMPHRSNGDGNQNHPNQKNNDDGVHPDVHKAERATDDGAAAEVDVVVGKEGGADATLRRGTGPVAQMGYVVDLVLEREQASFRTTTTSDSQQQVSHVTQLWQRQQQESDNNDAAAAASTDSWHACVSYPPRVSSTSSNSQRATQAAACSDTRTPLYAYNSAPFVRYYDNNCGSDGESDTVLRMEPHQVVRLKPCGTTTNGNSNEPHQQHVRLFRQSVDHTDVQNKNKNTKNHLPTTTILSRDTALSPESSMDAIATRTVACPVPCAVDETVTLSSSAGSSSSNTNGGALADKHGVTQLTIKGHTDWTVYHSTDDPYYNGNAKIERTSFRRNLYYSTASLVSSVPLSFYDLNVYKASEYSKHIIDWTKAANKVTYLMDEDCTSGRRNKWVAALEAVMDVEAYGSCQHNTDLGPGETLDTLEGRLALMRKNRVTLVLESGTDKDYVTSLVWEALLAGNVPAIVGAGNLEQRLPPHAAIYGSNFNTWDKFAAHIRLVTANQTLYETHQQWRKQPATIQAFVDTFEFTKQSPECRLCQWALAKEYGLGWNHSLQAIQSTQLPRGLCHSKARVTHPFVEQWLSVAPKTKVEDRVAASTSRRTLTEMKACTTQSGGASNELFGEVSASNYKVERTVYERDGVIDIVITKVERTPASASTETDDLVLRLVFDTIRNTDGAYFRDTHTLVTEATHVPIISSASLQDDTIKVSVLANWVTRLHCPGEGMLDVTIASGAIPIQDDETAPNGGRPRPRRIRIIVEDMNPLHDKMTEFFPSTFGRQMMHDFIDPLELYYDDA